MVNQCKLCGDIVPENDLREHAIEHQPNAQGMPYEGIKTLYIEHWE